MVTIVQTMINSRHTARIPQMRARPPEQALPYVRLTEEQLDILLRPRFRGQRLQEHHDFLVRRGSAVYLFHEGYYRVDKGQENSIAKGSGTYLKVHLQELLTPFD